MWELNEVNFFIAILIPTQTNQLNQTNSDMYFKKWGLDNEVFNKSLINNITSPH